MQKTNKFNIIEIFFFERKRIFIYLFISLIISLIGGFIYYYNTKNLYAAKITSIVKESNESMKGFASVAADFGIENEEGASLFKGFNLLWLYTSEMMITNSLLTTIENDNNVKIINRLILNDSRYKKIFNRYKKNYPNTNLIDKNVKDFSSLNIEQKRLIKGIIKHIKDNDLISYEEDKTQGIFTITFKSQDEIVAKNLVENLVYLVNEFYISQTTRKVREQVALYEDKLDEYNAKLNKSITEVAENIEKVPFPNPNIQSINIKPKRQTVDIETQSVVYSNIINQLELAKKRLLEVTPIIDIIDVPDYPLTNLKKPLYLILIFSSAIGILVGVFVIIIYYYFRYEIKLLKMKSQ